MKASALIISLVLVASTLAQQWSACQNEEGTADPQCTTDLSNIYSEINATRNGTSNQTSLTTNNYITMSGRFFNDFGEFQGCQDTNTSHYITIYFTSSTTGTTVPMMIGFCAPQSCSAQDSAINAELVWLIFAESNFNLGLVNNTPCNAEFYDPNFPNVDTDFSTVLIFIILISFSLLTIFGTSLNCYREMKDSFKTDNQKAELGDEEDSQKKKRKLRGIYLFLDCFDAKKNFSRIVTVKITDSYDYNLEIFNGLRVFMFLWVVCGHTYLFGTTYIDNIFDLQSLAQGWWLLIVYAALQAVDAFFFMSGFFLAFIATGKLAKMKPNAKNYVGLIFHRLFRIWPAYAFAILFFYKVLPYMGNGPVWFEMTSTTALCDNGHVFENLSFTDDFLVTSANYCYGWGWYLSNDFQMFLITPFFLWMYIKNREKAKWSMLLISWASIFFAIFYGYHLGVVATPPTTGGITNPVTFTDYYVKPYIRWPPYFFGVLVGLFYREYKEKYGWSFKFGTLCRTPGMKIFLEWGGFALMMFVTLFVRQVETSPAPWPPFFHAIYRALQKPVYVIAMTMIILPSLLGEDTLLKKFLSHPLLVPMARISFTAYLVHLFWVYRNYYNQTAAFHYSNETVIFNTIANSVIAFATAMILSLLAEVPIANIESTYLMPKKRPPKKADGPPAEPKPEYKPPQASEEVNKRLNAKDVQVDEQ